MYYNMSFVHKKLWGHVSSLVIVLLCRPICRLSSVFLPFKTKDSLLYYTQTVEYCSSTYLLYQFGPAIEIKKQRVIWIIKSNRNYYYGFLGHFEASLFQKCKKFKKSCS